VGYMVGKCLLMARTHCEVFNLLPSRYHAALQSSEHVGMGCLSSMNYTRLKDETLCAVVRRS
jgi:hypothetical protein